MNLSSHFTLEEMVVSDTAVRAGIPNVPSAQTIINLTHVAKNLEEVRTLLGELPIKILSGYRSLPLNQRVGGAKDSMHIQGLAADILCPQFGSPLDICRVIAGSTIPFDQIIHEFGRWCHVGFARDGVPVRRELLTIANPATGYEMGLLTV